MSQMFLFCNGIPFSYYKVVERVGYSIYFSL